jgi:hypothetical protein
MDPGPLTQQKPSSNLINRSQAARQYANNARPPVSPRPAHNPNASGIVDQELKRAINTREAIHKTQTREYLEAKKRIASQSGSASQKQRMAPPLGQPQARQAAPQRPAGKTEASLPPNNTEVLEFLRNVAELMDQDGKANVAKGIQKGLGQRQP